MVSTTYTSHKFQCLIIFKAANADAGLLWIPTLGMQQECQRGLRQYKLGQWVVFDQGSERILQPMEQQPYETQLFECNNERRDIFVQVKVPVIYFSDKKHNQLVAYSPAGFGRIGSFYQQPNLVMDTVYDAWIAFMGLYQDDKWQKLMASLNAKWVIVNLGQPFGKKEMIRFIFRKQFDLVKGIIVSIAEENIQYEENSRSSTFLQIKFWNEQFKICIFRMDKDQFDAQDEQQKNEFSIGSWHRFIPVQNWSNEYCAINPFAVEMPAGISVLGKEPSLKVKISHEFYKLDPDPAANCVHVPGWFGTLQASATFIAEFRQARQQRPLQAPRLFAEFNGYDGWRLVYFDGYRDGSPPSELRVQEPEAKPEQSNELPTTTTTLNNACTTTNKLAGGFGCSRTSKLRFPPVSNVPGQQHAKHEKKPDTTQPPTDQQSLASDDYSHLPSVSSAFEQASGVDNNNNDDDGFLDRLGRGGGRGGDSGNSGRVVTQRQHKQFRPWNRSGDQFNSNTNRPISTGRRPNSRLQIPPLKRAKKNLYGVVVSLAKNGEGFYIYTPEYPDEEIFLHHSSTSGDLKHGSWIKFDLLDDQGQLKITKYTLDHPDPFTTIPTRNTIQLKIYAFVPRIWRPQMPNHKGVLETEFVSQVVDINRLIDEECAEQQLKVLVERVANNETGAISWHIIKVLDT